MVHTPAYGYLDKIPGFGNIGSQGIRRYLDDAEKRPSLVVSGHIHEDQGIIKKGKTVFLNPSNFGPVDSVYGFQQGGFFSEITIENKLVSSIGLYRLIDGKKTHLMQVDTTSKNLKVDYMNKISPVSEEEFVRK
jgi:Icc-related predicted phosphoesterase